MILKKYFEFMNEMLNLVDYKDEILALNDIIKDKLNLSLAPVTFSKERAIAGSADLQGIDFINDNHDILIGFYILYEKGITKEDIINKLDFPFDFDVLLKPKELEKHINQSYFLTYNLDEMLESKLGKSLTEINKYNL